MNRLRVTGGDGRLSRAGRIIIFSLEPDQELHDVRPRPGGDVFKALATLIVQRDFAVPSFAAIDLEASGLFLFGEIEIEVDGALVSGADSATWVEQRFTAGAAVASSGTACATADTDLVEGCVPAGAFSLNQAAVIESAVVEPVVVESAVVEPVAVEAGSPNEAVGDQTPDQSQPAQSQTAAPEARQPSVLDDPGIRLDEIGAPANPVEAPVAERTLDAEPFDTFSSDETEEPSEHDDPIGAPEPQPASTPQPATSAPFRAPPSVPALRANGADEAAGQIPAPSSPPPGRKARLVCGNGRTVAIDTGLLVGRFPSKHGVPDGFETLKVLGAEVSRVHLMFVLDGDVLYVQDQNTSNGSTLLSAQRAIRPVPSGSGRVQLEPGDAVEFGDQTMTFEGWEQIASA